MDEADDRQGENEEGAEQAEAARSRWTRRIVKRRGNGRRTHWILGRSKYGKGDGTMKSHRSAQGARATGTGYVFGFLMRLEVSLFLFYNLQVIFFYVYTPKSVTYQSDWLNYELLSNY